MKQRIICEIPERLYSKAKSIASRIGMSTASLISMMISDTLLSSTIKVDDVTRNKNEKNFHKLHIQLDDGFYEKMQEFVYGHQSYTMKNFIIDCVEFQIGNFETLYALKNREHIKREKISNTKTDKYLKSTKLENTKIEPLNDYLRAKSIEWGINLESVKKYYLAKQINEIFKKYVKEQEVFEDPYDRLDY